MISASISQSLSNLRLRFSLRIRFKCRLRFRLRRHVSFPTSMRISILNSLSISRGAIARIGTWHARIRTHAHSHARVLRSPPDTHAFAHAHSHARVLTRAFARTRTRTHAFSGVRRTRTSRRAPTYSPPNTRGGGMPLSRSPPDTAPETRPKRQPTRYVRQRAALGRSPPDTPPPPRRFNRQSAGHARQRAAHKP